MNAEDYEWFGVIYPEDVKANVTFITPLAFYNPEGIWESIAFDARRQWFPSNGKAVIFDKNFPLAKTNQLLLFRPERNRQIEDAYPNAYGYSHYLVSSNLQSPQLAQIFDWTARVTHTFDAPDLLDQGIPVQECYCQRIYIACSLRLFGPIKLERDAERDIYRPREYILSSNTGGQPLFIWMYTKPEDGIITMRDNHRQTTYLDESMLDTPTGKEDWSLSQVTIKRVLQASNEVLDSIEDNVHLVDKRVRDLARLSSQEGPHVLHLDAATLKRASYILSIQIDRLHELRDIIGQLSVEHPMVKLAREIEIQARSQELEQEAVARIKEKQQQLEQFQSEILLAQEKLNQLQSAVDTAQQSQHQAMLAMNIFEQAVHEQLASLKAEPLRVLAEHQIMASLLPMLMEGSVQPAYEMHIPPPLSSAAYNPDDSIPEAIVSISGLDWEIRDDAETFRAPLHTGNLKKRSHIAQQSGVNPQDVRICIAAMLSGLIPTIHGDAALTVLRIVAQIIARGRDALVPVPITALTTLDLFGLIDPHRQALVPSNGLADCIIEAQAHPDELVVIVLEGIDRVPGMPTYVPLLRQYIERQYSIDAVNIAPLALFHPRAVRSNDPYLQLAGFTWPSNVILSATFDDELTNYSLPSICDSWVVDKEINFKDGSSYPHRTASSLSSSSLEQWKTWQDEVRALAAGNKDFHGLLNQRQKLFYAALSLLEIKNPDLLIELIWPNQFQQDEVEEGIG